MTMMMKDIILGPPKYEILMIDAVEYLTEHGYNCVPNPGDSQITEQHIAQYKDTCSAVIAGPEYWGPQQLDLLPNLRILAKCGVGLDSVDLEATRARGITVTNTPRMNSNAVAEFTVALIIAGLRGLFPAATAMQNNRRIHIAGYELNQKTIGIVGWGAIGQLVAQRLSGFNPRIVVFDPYSPVASDAIIVVDTLEELVSVSDVVTLHLPATPETTLMINSDLLSKFRPGALLINAARGALVDEYALAQALDAGQLTGACLDVLQDETDTPNSPLLGRSNVLITPHLGAETWEAYRAVGAANAEDILTVLAGKKSTREIQ